MSLQRCDGLFAGVTGSPSVAPAAATRPRRARAAAVASALRAQGRREGSQGRREEASNADEGSGDSDVRLRCRVAALTTTCA